MKNKIRWLWLEQPKAVVSMDSYANEAIRGRDRCVWNERGEDRAMQMKSASESCWLQSLGFRSLWLQLLIAGNYLPKKRLCFSLFSKQFRRLPWTIESHKDLVLLPTTTVSVLVSQ